MDIEIEEIKTLTDLMVDRDLSEIMIRDGDKRIVIRRSDRGATRVTASHAVLPPQAASPAGLPPAGQEQAVPSGEAKAPEEGPDLARITSPMVGTFYAAPDPDSSPYVKVGDRVNPDMVVCIIEAMKVFNEIKAETSGTIESIEIQNGEPVEFGQVMMTVQVG